MSSAALRYTAPSSRPWDVLGFLWALRDGGENAELRQTDAVVLLEALALADRAGECDLPQGHLAKKLGFSRRAVRDAIRRLEDRGILTCVGQSKTATRVLRFRLGLPVPSERATANRQRLTVNSDHGAAQTEDAALHEAADEPFEDSPAADPDAVPGGAGGNPSGGGGGNVRSHMGTCVPRSGNVRSPDRERAFPQRSELKKPEKESRRRRQSARAEESVDGSLFEPPTYDAAAAAALRAAGFSAREAHGLVHRFRPTVRQVRNIVANAACWRWEYRRGRRRDPLRSVSNFIRGSLREGRTGLDDQVLDVRRLARKRARAAAQRRRAGPSPAGTPSAAEDQDASYRAAFQVLSAEQVAALRDELTAEMPPKIASMLADKRSGGPSWLGYIVDKAREKGLLEAAEARDATME